MAEPRERPGSSGALFKAFQAQPGRRLPWALGSCAALLLGTAVWKVVHSSQGTFQVVTGRGVRTLVRGMSPLEVSSLLGPPVVRDPRAGPEGSCFRYGRPSFEGEHFTLYSVCFEQGERLRDATAHRYRVWRVEPPLGPRRLPESKFRAPVANAVD